MVCLFDFRGCGNSSEEYVTLGLREKFDLTFILRIVSDALRPERIYLWGRSMGAATVIHYLHHQLKLQKKKVEVMLNEEMIKKPSQIAQIDHDFGISKRIKGLILDSPFTDSYDMVLDVMKNNMNIPKSLGQVILLPVSSSIKNNVKFDVLENNKPLKLASKLDLPACFMIGEKDVLIDHVSFTDMFEKYGGEQKRLRILENTDHADFRDEKDIEFAWRFIEEIEEREKVEYLKLMEMKNDYFEKTEKGVRKTGEVKRMNLTEKEEKKKAKIEEEKNIFRIFD